MNIFILIITAFFPAFVVLLQALKTKIPPVFMLIAFFAATAALFPVRFFQMISRFFTQTLLHISAFYSDFFTRFFNSFITAALIEEGCKTGVFILLSIYMQHCCKKSNTTVLPYHCLLTAFFFGCLFSGFENISYNIRYPQFQFLRICTASVLHGALGNFYFKILHTKTQTAAIGIFLAAVGLHGCYNFFAALGGWFMLPALAVIGLTLMAAGNTVQKITASNHKTKELKDARNTI